jgi:hypothetical protein
MVQHLEAADFGTFGLGNPTIGTARVLTVVHVVKGHEHKMRVRVENSTGSWWVHVFPYRQDQREIVEGDVIHARFIVHKRLNKVEAWANDVRLVQSAGEEPVETASITNRLSAACRMNGRILIHTLALMAISGETLDSWGIVDARGAREAVLSAIRKLPYSEYQLLLRAATAFDI